MSGWIHLRELHLREATGKQIDLSEASATLLLNQSVTGQRSWSITVDSDQFLAVQLNTYVAEMVTDDGRRLTGHVYATRTGYASEQGASIRLAGDGPLLEGDRS